MSKKTKKTSVEVLQHSKTRKESSSDNFIRAWRLYRNFETQEDLANETKKHDPKGEGLARNVICRLETSAYRWNMDHIKILAETLGCAPRDLIGTNPFDAGDIFMIYNKASKAQRKQIEEYLKKFA